MHLFHPPVFPSTFTRQATAQINFIQFQGVVKALPADPPRREEKYSKKTTFATKIITSSSIATKNGAKSAHRGSDGLFSTVHIIKAEMTVNQKWPAHNITSVISISRSSMAKDSILAQHWGQVSAVLNRNKRKGGRCSRAQWGSLGRVADYIVWNLDK